MVAGDRQADLGVNLEAPVFVEEVDVWRRKWIIVWEFHVAVIEAALEGRALNAAHREVPVEVVVRERLDVEVLVGNAVIILLLLKSLGVLHEVVINLAPR